MIRSKKQLRAALREERGDAQIIEYAIVLPICLLVFFFLFMVGFMLSQYALIESAAERGILIAQKSFSDTNAAKMMSMDTMTATSSAGFQPAGEPDYDTFENDPYRFLNKNYQSASITSAVTDAVKSIIRKGQLLEDTFLGETTVTYTPGSGFLDKNVSVTVEQEFKPLSAISKLLGLQSGFKLRYTARLKINSQTEFIRNTDLVLDLALRFGLDKYTQKIAGFFQKITDFFNKT